MPRALSVFVGIAFGFSWAVAELYYRLLGPSLPGDVLMPILYMAGPGVAAVVVQRWVLRQPLRALGPVFRFSPWLLLAWIGPLLFAIAYILLSAAPPSVELQVDTPGVTAVILEAVPAPHRAEAQQRLLEIGDALAWVLVAQMLLGALIGGATINAVVAFGEELGWRGLLPRLLGRHGFWAQSAIIGVIWGLWHAPLILRGHNYPEHPQLGVLMMLLFCVGLSPLFLAMRERAGSLLSVSLMHGSLNASAGLSVFVAGASDLWRGPAGAAGILILLALNLLLWRLRARSLA